MRIMLLLLALVALSTKLSAAGDSVGYTLAEATEFRNQWTAENWDEGGPLMRYVFLNMPEFWNHSVIHRAGPVRELPLAPRREVASFSTRTALGDLPLSEYVVRSTVNGLLVMHRGEIVYEAYPKMRPFDKHLLMSVSKAMVATIIAILEDREMIDVQRGIETYLPSLQGSGWEGVPVRDILDMASGIDCLEGAEGAYTDSSTCYYQYEAALGWLPATGTTMDSVYDYIATLESHRPSGEAFEYTSPDTFVLQWLATAVTGKTFADLLSAELWQKLGAESDAVIAAPRRGVPISHGGISATLRDVARFGLLFTPGGRGSMTPLVSERYLDNIQEGGRPEIFRAARGPDAGRVDGEPARHNSYQWDFVMDDGDFFKGGYGGQGLYISPARDLVIAFFGTFDEERRGHEMTRVARQLATSGLFE